MLAAPDEHKAVAARKKWARPRFSRMTIPIFIHISDMLIKKNLNRQGSGFLFLENWELLVAVTRTNLTIIIFAQ